MVVMFDLFLMVSAFTVLDPVRYHKSLQHWRIIDDIEPAVVGRSNSHREMYVHAFHVKANELILNERVPRIFLSKIV